MFDDEKIRLIERMPDGDSILVIWVKLLAYAGKVNCNGFIMINENIAMNIEQVAIIFNRPFEKVKYAISVLQKFGMLEVSEEEVIAITNWEKHQNIDGMEKIRIQNRERKRKEREKKKTLLLDSNDNVTCHVTVTQSHATDIEKEKEKEKEKDIKDKENEMLPIYKNIIEHLNLRTGKKYRYQTKSTQDSINARLKEGFTIEDFYKVIDVKTEEWLNTEHDQYLTPDTLFRPSKFEKYLNQKFKHEVVSAKNRGNIKASPIDLIMGGNVNEYGRSEQATNSNFGQLLTTNAENTNRNGY